MNYTLENKKKYFVEVRIFEDEKDFKLSKFSEKTAINDFYLAGATLLENDFILKTDEPDFKRFEYVGNIFSIKEKRLYLFEEVELLEFLRNWSYEI